MAVTLQWVPVEDVLEEWEEEATETMARHFQGRGDRPPATSPSATRPGAAPAHVR